MLFTLLLTSSAVSFALAVNFSFASSAFCVKSSLVDLNFAVKSSLVLANFASASFKKGSVSSNFSLPWLNCVLKSSLVESTVLKKSPT